MRDGWFEGPQRTPSGITLRRARARSSRGLLRGENERTRRAHTRTQKKLRRRNNNNNKNNNGRAPRRRARATLCRATCANTGRAGVLPRVGRAAWLRFPSAQIAVRPRRACAPPPLPAKPFARAPAQGLRLSDMTRWAARGDAYGLLTVWGH